MGGTLTAVVVWMVFLVILIYANHKNKEDDV